jgi:hypothetical protein
MPKDLQQKMVLKDGPYWLPDEALSLYLQAHSLFTPEPHSLIFSLGNGVPGVHIYDWAFGRKAQMFPDLGLGEWAFDLRRSEAGPMGDALLGIYRDRTAALAKVKALQQRVEAKRQAAFATIRRSMKA